MPAEPRTITVTGYRDPEGRPTCAAGHGENCCFLHGLPFRGPARCRAKPFVQPALKRADGYLRPCAGCPVWAKEADNGK